MHEYYEPHPPPSLIHVSSGYTGWVCVLLTGVRFDCISPLFDVIGRPPDDRLFYSSHSAATLFQFPGRKRLMGGHV